MLLQNLKKKNVNAPIAIDDEIELNVRDDEDKVRPKPNPNPGVVVGPPETCGVGDMTDEASQKSSNDGTDSQSTITLSNPSQDFELFLSQQRIPPKTVEKEVQTDECVIISKEEYEDLLKKASSYVDYKKDLEKLSRYFSCVFNRTPEMDVHEFEMYKNSANMLGRKPIQFVG